MMTGERGTGSEGFSKSDGPPNVIGLVLLLVVACIAEWAAAEHASHVPYQASLFVFVPVIAVLFGVAAGFLCRSNRDFPIYTTLPLVSRSLGVFIAVGNTHDSGRALWSMVALLGVPGWILTVVVFAVAYLLRTRVLGSHRQG